MSLIEIEEALIPSVVALLEAHQVPHELFTSAWSVWAKNEAQARLSQPHTNPPLTAKQQQLAQQYLTHALIVEEVLDEEAILTLTQQCVVDACIAYPAEEKKQVELTVIFEDKRGNMRPIATVTSQEDAYRVIHGFCEARQFTIHYLRSWSSKNQQQTTVDVGSHTECFHIVQTTD